MKEQNSKTINEILDEDSAGKMKHLSERTPVGIPSILFNLILLFLSLLLNFAVENGDLELSQNHTRIFRQISLFVSSFFTVNLIFLTALKIMDTNGKSQEFLPYALHQNSYLVRISATILVFLLDIKLTAWYNNITSPVAIIPADGLNEKQTVLNNLMTNDDIASDATGKENTRQKLIFEDYLESKYESIITSFLILFGFVLIKRVLLQFINYRIHYKYYKERIRKNEKIVKYLQNLNTVPEMQLENDLEIFTNEIFNTMSNNNETLSLSDFKRHFDNREGIKIFTLFDMDENGEVTRDEFLTRYKSLIQEKEQLDIALHSNTSSIHKLNAIISILFYPITFLLILFCLDAHSRFTSAFKFISAILLSVSFAFSSIVSSTFKSIIFVFFVRPFDIGDFIEYDGKVFFVADLGLLYSTFLSDSRYETVPNDELSKKSIKNLRKSTHATVNYTYNVNKNIIDTLRSKIDAFLASNPTKYHESCRIKNIKQDYSGIEFTVVIVVSCPYQEMNTLEERKDKFSLFVIEELKDMDVKVKQS